MRIINTCRGWGCDSSPYCEKYRYIPEAERERCYVREFIPTSPGLNCPDFEPKKRRRWGVGSDGED